MRIYLENEEGPELDLDYMEIGNLVTEGVLDYENCPYESQVELLLTNNAEIQRINNEFRGIDRPTDVLSFPMIPFETPADYSIVEDKDEFFDLDTDELILGDVMISVEKVYAQAEEYGHSVEREFSFLFAHSMLHLLGYDHMEDEERLVMEEKQRNILDNLGITR